jgi:hypothetical protein
MSEPGESHKPAPSGTLPPSSLEDVMSSHGTTDPGCAEIRRRWQTQIPSLLSESNLTRSLDGFLLSLLFPGGSLLLAPADAVQQCKEGISGDADEY